ncbi:PRC-barrel domain-containing protein [uncultured Mucilaginibacter sp.]|uniref:PRC-barrel domain-containing protein n=1 Tax=uncultured Mucilaginibacter sp. TaxID=797541 RepID=UPI0025D29998|nr:PRC-barrel domain-containing protein [uncultured Mucilaginibacter sp.]
MEENEYSRLEELTGSDFEIADGQPDIKGWDVKNEQGEVIGDVEELLFNPQTQKVRYIIVDTDANDLKLEARKILIPIGVVELHEDDDFVVVPQIEVNHIVGLPSYVKGELTAEHEQHIRSTFSSLGAAGVGIGAVTAQPTENFYEHEQFNQNRIYNRRRPENNPERLLPEEGTREDETDNRDIF